MTVGKLYFEIGVGQNLGDNAFEFYDIVFSQNDSSLNIVRTRLVHGGPRAENGFSYLPVRCARNICQSAFADDSYMPDLFLLWFFRSAPAPVGVPHVPVPGRKHREKSAFVVPRQGNDYLT